LEELGRDLSQLFRHAIADILPTEGEVGAHLVYGWVVSRIIECAQSPSGFLAEARLGSEEYLH